MPYLAAGQQRSDVLERPAARARRRPNEPHQRRNARAASGEGLDRLHRVGDEALLSQQVTRRIAHHRKLVKDHQLGAGGLGAADEIGHLARVAGDVAHHGVELRQREVHVLLL
jgi:hypothetical protein